MIFVVYNIICFFFDCYNFLVIVNVPNFRRFCYLMHVDERLAKRSPLEGQHKWRSDSLDGARKLTL